MLSSAIFLWIMKRQSTGLLRLVPMAIIMGTIFFLSHQPGDVLYIPPVAGLDKVAHMSIYAVLAATVLYAFSPLLCDDKKLMVSLLTIGICVLYGVSDEFFCTRTFSKRCRYSSGHSGSSCCLCGMVQVATETA